MDKHSHLLPAPTKCKNDSQTGGLDGREQAGRARADAWYGWMGRDAYVSIPDPVQPGLALSPGPLFSDP
jgi:hypothetical protein